MIKTLTTKDIVNVLMGEVSIANLTTLYSTEPTVKQGSYGRISIVSQNNNTNSMNGYLVKEARFSVALVAPHSEGLVVDEETYLNNVIDAIRQYITDTRCSKIHNWGDIIPLYCTEDSETPLLFTVGDRAYKIKDFLLGYEAQHV